MSDNIINDIYIDCQPVNSDGQTVIKYDSLGDDGDISKAANEVDFKKIASHPAFGIVVGAIGLFIIIKVSKYILKKL